MLHLLRLFVCMVGVCLLVLATFLAGYGISFGAYSAWCLVSPW